MTADDRAGRLDRPRPIGRQSGLEVEVDAEQGCRGVAVVHRDVRVRGRGLDEVGERGDVGRSCHRGKDRLNPALVRRDPLYRRASESRSFRRRRILDRWGRR